MNCIAIDDEPLALNVIKNHCEQIPFLKLKGTFTSPVDAIEYLKQASIQIVFLDINMPEIDGLNLNTFIPEHVQIIFITAYEEHALASYDIGATDYLLKPVSLKRFYQAVLKCQEKIRHEAKQEPNPSILVRSEKKIIQVPVSDILYIEGLKDYVKIFLTNTRKLIVRESLQRILQQLEKHHFIRVHRSYIIALNKITSYSGNLVYLGSQEIPIGRSFKRDLSDYFNRRGILGERKS